MTYPPGPPGIPGYQPPQPPGPYGASGPSFVKTGGGPRRLALYLQIAVVVLGLITYLVSFGPLLVPTEGDFGGGMQVRGTDVGYAVTVAVVAALLAAVGLLPKAKNYNAVVGVVAVLGALLAISQALTVGDFFSVGWALWLVLASTAAQGVVAVAVLLLDAGVVTAPAPRPKYDPYAPYGPPPGGGYYEQSGQLGVQPATGPQPSYSSYGGYPATPPPGGYGGPATGGFGAQPPPPGGFGSGPQPIPPHGPPTPPTGFPSFAPPPGGGSAAGAQGHDSANSEQTQQSPNDPSSRSSSSTPPDQP